ncbi:MAG: tetratricopeptide repeat protein, partial [Cyanobacteria bacterium P01_H01_bin.121]
MTEKRKRWLINSFLFVSLIAFIGFSIAPLLGGFRRPADHSATAPYPQEAGLSGEQQSLLENQAQGYELVLQREPDNETALRGLLETRLEMGDIPGAIAPLERLADLKPEQPEYTILLAQAKQQVDDREGAAQAYRSILANQPGNLGALQGLVGLLLEQDRPEAAIGLLQDTVQLADQANEIQPDSVDVP